MTTWTKLWISISWIQNTAVYPAKHTNTTQTHSQCEVSSPLPPHLITGKASPRNVAKSKIISKEVLDLSQVFCFVFKIGPNSSMRLQEQSLLLHTLMDGPQPSSVTASYHAFPLSLCSSSGLIHWVAVTPPLSSSCFPLCHEPNHMYTYSTTSQGGCPQSRNRGLVLANGRL